MIAIYFRAGGAASHDPEFADTLVFTDSFEDEFRGRVVAVFKPFVVGAAVKALRGESDAGELLWGRPLFLQMPASSPEVAWRLFSVRGLVGARAAVGASEFHQVWLFGVEGDGGVEPVAAQVHQPSAVGGELPPGRELVACDVLGVAAGDDDPVVAQEV